MVGAGDSLGIRDAKIRGEEEIKKRRLSDSDSRNAAPANSFRHNTRVFRPTMYALVGIVILALFFAVVWIVLWA